ncbi:thioredoxin family protein [Caldalkalibacillus salinus]|uniref:thioredoxin family protein n=1 Tax=Caldalkalibacillus salinus TaxID=2803787 RepID=UPI001920C3CD|nr:thioredoxin family protein [Caldalkalibacillus salinus]
MKELSPEELEGLLRFNRERKAVYVYTPLCGTCKVATKMLEIVENTMPSLEILRINLNQAPQLAKEWKVKSVPCLLILSQNQIVFRKYAFESVHTLYDTFRKMKLGS